ncbi:type III secretion system outer membrane ring subunit SctC [Roseateles sp. SL47]|uniref:type III secretion system outer membrane ring subunit SctC n=1 Tax=Roseateles sp. SL47 TaxID=2995138 RepID=UPI00227056CF|nr:type III secretion system outer membrane ring subunit SctC [Roseateles sp. SL47]WAC75177.1 type III secretion system outer membrane ring subunit SctC [Roseateles sp. SL47]
MRGPLRWGLVLLSLTAVFGPAHAVAPAGWKDILYSNRADDEATLDTVLQQFAATTGVELRLSDVRLGQKRMLALPTRGSAPAAFLDQLAQSLSLDWYVYRGVLYVSPQSSGVRARVELAGQTPAAARQALVGLGLFEPRFGWGELDTDPPMVLVEGPATYVAAVRNFLETPKPKPVEPERPKLMVFRLQHAVAQDREVQIRGVTTRQPGLASALKELMVPPTSRRTDAAFGRSGASGLSGALGGAGGTGGFGEGASRSVLGGASGLSAALGGAGGLSAALGGLPAASSGAPADALSALSGRDFLSSPLPDALVPGGNRRKSGGGSAQDALEEERLREERAALPTIGAYPPLNAVLVWDLPSRRTDYAAVIAELDVPTRQVEINVTILDVNANALREWAVDLSAGSGAARVQVNPAGSIRNDGSSDVAGGSSMVLWATDRLSLRLRALESRGQAQVMSRPSILTQDNHAAVLDMSQSVYVKLVGERTSDLRSVSAGTLLRVTPSVMGEGSNATIRVTLDIDDGALSDSSGVGGASGDPRVGNSSVSTQAVVRPGESLVVGGYRRQNTETAHSRVPGLDSLPLLGWLFRGDSVISNERERLFIVTARVLP